MMQIMDINIIGLNGKRCFPHEEGGLGIRGFEDISKAFAYKLWWTFRQGKPLWSEYLQTSYCKGRHPSQVQLLVNASHNWRRMIRVRDSVELNTHWIVGKKILMPVTAFWLDSVVDNTVHGLQVKDNFGDRSEQQFT